MNGRKRHIVTDTMGLLLVVLATAGVQDRDGGRGILARLHRALPVYGFAPFFELESTIGIGTLCGSARHRGKS